MKNQKLSVRTIVSYLNDEDADGGFWLPNIQRSFVWSEEQIERLFDSIMREYPISTLLVWRTNSEIRYRNFIANYHSNLRISDFFVPQNSKRKLLVLDGQQRLQSLYIGLKGSYEKRELYIDILSGDPVMPEDIRHKFKLLDPNTANFPWVKFKDIVFDTGLFTSIAKKIIKHSGLDLSESQENKINENVARIVQQFNVTEMIVYQELDSVQNPEAYTEDDIVEIFIRANSGGTRLEKSDLLFALLVAKWDYANERMEEILSDLNRTGYAFNRDFILKTCLTLLNRGAKYEVKKFRDDSTRQEVEGKWDEISTAIRDVRDFLTSDTLIRTDKALPSYLVLIPLIYFRYHFPQKWKGTEQKDEFVIRSLIAGAFSGTPDNLIDKCVNEISKTGVFDVNKIFGIIRADGRNLEITSDKIFSLYYGSKDLHLIFNLWYKGFDYRPTNPNNLPQVDHIFPQSLLKSVKVVNPETGHKKLKYPAAERDQIANCMLLTADENGSGGKTDIPPEIWFAEKGQEFLDKHLIPRDTNLWKLENYEKFIEERKKLILEKFGYMIQPKS